jgi:hypothetical protein
MLLTAMRQGGGPDGRFRAESYDFEHANATRLPEFLTRDLPRVRRSAELEELGQQCLHFSLTL